MTSRTPDEPPASGPHGGAPSLAQVLGVGGMDLVEVVRAPRGTDVAVRGVGVFDAGETLEAAGQVLVAVGVDTSSAEAAGVLRAAARAGAAALIMRRGAEGISEGLLAAAGEAGTALLARAPWIEWGELIGLLRAALSRSGAKPEAAVDVALGDLPGLAVALAALVGGAITIEDPDSNVLAYSPTADTADPLRRLTILGRRVPQWRVAELAESGFLSTLWATPDVVHRPADSRFPERLAIAVRAGDEILGSLWAAADGEPLPPGARDALRAAAATAVPHLLHHRLRSRSAASRRKQAVRALLEGRTDVPAAAAALEADPQVPCAVLTVTVAPPPPSPDALDRALHLASLRAAAHHTPAFAHRDGDRLDVLLTDPAPGAAHRFGGELAAVLRGSGVRPLVAVGPVGQGLGEAARSRTEAALVLRVLRERGTPEVAAADDVRHALDALRVVDAVAALSPSATDAVRELLAYDAEHGTDLPRTVAVHLAFFGDAAATARHLGIHPNTLRYRLRRVRELFGLDLEDPDVRLLTELGLRRAGLIPPG
ncbi:DNA-binding protein [Streptomyces sp. Ru73]|uniref:PucR family transcriptional regulator n=1 Tax=Streptomyces sp. Ru73 TaxID=2080748 RepID=UPI000CDDE886|nr:helix-turn-helix domain-containing protein [Streptomyces sp. Ru73]POX41105.1 DNA-binding protein [Streptomyces sp. Ru73]